MRTRPIDPAIETLLDEAENLPDCAARNAVLERAAATAETLQDMDAAWDARCRLLSSVTIMASPRFESLFVSLAWCLAVSDREPQRFQPDQVLWQYKWVVEQASEYARIPKAVLLRLVEDMDRRFLNARWGPRAGLYKRSQLHQSLGEFDAALALVPAWRAVPRDHGADCLACETNGLVDLLMESGDDQAAAREASPILRGRMSCATVPQSTFGNLFDAFQRLGRLADAERYFDKGLPAILELDEFGAGLAGPFFHFAARRDRADQAIQLLRRRLRAWTELQSDLSRAHAFGRLWRGLECLHARGVDTVELSPTKGWVECETVSTRDLAERCRAEAFLHAGKLDARNGNSAQVRWLERLPSD